MSSVHGFQPPGAFAREVARRAQSHFRHSGESRFADTGLWARATCFAGLGLAAYIALLSGLPWPGSVACIVVAAFCAFMLVAQLGHDASHGSLAPAGWVNEAALFGSFAVLGVDSDAWRDRHIRLHHQVVNLPGTGIDADSVEFLRLAPDKPWRPLHRLQPLYGPLLYLVGHASMVWLDDLATHRSARRAGRAAGTKRFVAGKLIHAALFLVIPAILLQPGWATLLAGYLLASAVIACCFAVLIIGTHVSDLAAFPDRAEAAGMDWASHQLATSVDWSPCSGLAAALTGGANAHVAHHLFPGHSHRHAAVLSGIIAEAARAHGLRHRVTSFGGMVAGHWRHLLALSRPGAAA